MIRRSCRLIEQKTEGKTTLYRVTRIHILGFCVFTNTVEMPL